MPGKYDADTEKFISDVTPTRDPSPRPTPTQSPDVQPGSTAATYPDGWKEHVVPVAKQTIKAISRIREGGSPAAVLTKAVMRTGIREALKEQEKVASVSEALATFESMNKTYGAAWHDWEPETIARTLELDSGAPPSPTMMDQLQAFQVVLNTNQAHENWHILSGSFS